VPVKEYIRGNFGEHYDSLHVQRRSVLGPVRRIEGIRFLRSSNLMLGSAAQTRDRGGMLPTKHVRATRGSRVVVIVSARLHKSGRDCARCGARWTVQIKKEEAVHAWRDGIPRDKAILDYTGNNVAVECCQKRA
jgi:hypothetical protein